jgi:hypothetical protein
MTVRPFDWRDLPALHRFRQRTVFLHSELVLTRGPLLVPGALFSYLAPAMGLFTATVNGGESPDPIIGQVMQSPGGTSAHLTFLTPEETLRQPSVAALLENLAVISGELGAFRLLADVDERTSAFEALRRDSFSIYSRQRIWQLNRPENGRPPVGSGWRSATSQDALPVRSLYNNLVPALVQQVEPFNPEKPRGLVYYQNGDLRAYVDLRYGHRGIWVQPFIHPDAEDVEEWFVELLQLLPARHSRPVYVCVRSYQSWLEPAVEDLGAVPGPRQAVMVKHLAQPQRARATFAMPVLESGRPEISTPIAHIGE